MMKGYKVFKDDDIKYCTNKIIIVKEVKKPRAKSNTSVSNTGYYNSGDCNSGDCNSGDWNSGDWNSGDCNSGDWNSGDWNSGLFCTSKNPTVKLFDKDSNWTITDWFRSEAYDVMCKCPCTHSCFIDVSDMTEEEKEKYPEYKTIGGYIKTIIATKELKQEWWDGLSEKSKKVVMSLPNFDSKKFEECTGIKVESEE